MAVLSVFTSISTFNGISIPAGLVILYLIGLGIYNIYFHPLAKFPGPLLWRITRLSFISSMVRGNLVADVQKIHEQYGDIVRLAPDELSFAKDEAWHDIFSNRAGHQTFLKNPIFFKAPPGQPENMVTTRDTIDNARMRKLLSSAFTEPAVVAQENIVQSYADLLMYRLREKAMETDCRGYKGVVNIVDWYNFYTFDVIGDLGFGEPFNCLKDGGYHPWVSLIFNFLKGMTLAAATRYYAWIEYALMSLIPKNIRQMQKDHYDLALEKIHRRLNLETPRNDFMSPVVDNNRDFERMSLEEVESTYSMLIIAGSETTATTLSGTTNYLIQNPAQLQTLVSEIRSTFAKESDITFAACKELPFLNAVIHEGLRLCNPVPAGLPRLVPKGGDTICGHFLPAYTNVSVHPTTLSLSPQNFHLAPSFLPARWLPPPLRPAEFEHDKRSVMQPFGLGPRNCIGRNLAWAQMRTVLARLVWGFDVQEVEGEGMRCEWRALKTFIVVQKEAVWVRVGVRGMEG